MATNAPGLFSLVQGARAGVSPEMRVNLENNAQQAAKIADALRMVADAVKPTPPAPTATPTLPSPLAPPMAAQPPMPGSPPPMPSPVAGQQPPQVGPNIPGIPGRAAGGDVQLPQGDQLYTASGRDQAGAAPAGPPPNQPDMYTTLAGGGVAQGEAAAPPAPAGGNAVTSVSDPLAPVLSQIAGSYGLIDSNGQPDLATARQYYMSNPAMFVGSGSPAVTPTLNIPGQERGGDVFVPGYQTPVATTTPAPSQDQPAVTGPPGYSVTDPNFAPSASSPSFASVATGLGADLASSSAPNYSEVSPALAALTPTPPPSTSADTSASDSDSIYITALAQKTYGSVDASTYAEAKALWATMAPGLQAGYRTQVNSLLGSGGAATAASTSAATAAADLAQRANEFAQTMAFNRETEAHKMDTADQTAAAAQQDALQKYYDTKVTDLLNQKTLANDAASKATAAWQAGVNTANVPGWQNWRLAGGDQSNQIASNVPILNFNPAAAMGPQLAAPVNNNPAPNIPGINWNAQAA